MSRTLRRCPRRCPHCASEGAVSRGMARGLRRYQCKGCGRTFNALSGTPLSGLHHKERWLSFGASLAKGETVKASAARCDVAVSTAFRWRHRFLAAARAIRRCSRGSWKRRDLRPGEPEGRARAGTQGTAARQGEEARPLARAGAGSHGGRPERNDGQRGAAQGRCGGAHGCPRPGGREGRPLVSDGGASYPPCAAALGVSHEALNRSMGERVRGDLHVQTVRRLKDFLRPRRGIATRYLDNYLSWFHLVGLDRARFAEVTHTIH